MNFKRFLPLLLMVSLALACKPGAQATTPVTQESKLTAPSNSEKIEEPDGNVSDEIRARAPAGITQAYLNCMDRALGVIERGACISEEENRQDARLNSGYKKLHDLLDQDQKKLLIEAQRQWLSLQEKDGSFEASLFGSTQPENLTAAEREMFYIARRADLIQEWLDMAAFE